MSMMADAEEFGPRPAGGIFADTEWEPETVYQWLAKLRGWVSFPIWTVGKGNLGTDSFVLKVSQRTGKTYQRSTVPMWIATPEGRGASIRKCTRDYKITPIIQKLRSVVGLPALAAWRKRFKAELKAVAAYEKALRDAKRLKLPRTARPPEVVAAWDAMQSAALVVSWIGISTDEATRMKPSRVPWIRNRWPLIEVGMSRADCISWMTSRGYPEPPRSACVFCPYHNDKEWLRLKRDEPHEFQRAVKFERDYQAVAEKDEVIRGTPFLHDSCQPLDSIDFEARQKSPDAQLDLFQNQCDAMAMCGL